MHIKEKSKVIGWDDGPFEFDQEEMVPVVGAVTRGGGRLDGVVKTEIEKDGMNATNKLVSATNASKHKHDLSLILLDGITFAGFNVIDIKAMAERTQVPVIAVTKNRVRLESFRKALTNLPDFEQRWEAVNKAGEIRATRIRESKLYYQKASLPRKEADRVISITATHSTIPEPIRLADLIAKSIVSGES